jgi:hypothetical protein
MRNMKIMVQLGDLSIDGKVPFKIDLKGIVYRDLN